MTEVSAFVGHSFSDKDKDVVKNFLDFFENLKDIGISFSWDHAEKAEPKLLSQKVLEKIAGKNLFIGICTGKELVITQEKLKKHWLLRDAHYSESNNYELKTSDWILQEIGLAFGRGMEIILLIEEGLRNPGGIQGDIEYISFNRTYPERSHNRIMEMINSLISKGLNKSVLISEKVSEQPEQEITEIEKNHIFNLVIDEDWDENEFENALLNSILIENDEKEKEIFEEYKNRGYASKEYDLVKWEGLRLYAYRIYQNADNLSDIHDLHERAPNHPYILYLLGLVYYKEYENYKKSGTYFLQSAENSEDEREKINRLLYASKAYSKLGNYSDVLTTLEDSKKIKLGVPNFEEIILKAMIEIFKIMSEDEYFLTLSEALLKLYPNEYDYRFSAAYKYDDIGESDLSLYHYKQLIRHRPDETNFNNLGVAYSKLNLSVKSVETFHKSSDLNGTLAMSNLANQLITAGFIDEAETYCNKATQIENYDKNIGRAISRIKEVQDEENKKENTILKNIEQRRNFYSNYGMACLESQINDLEGLWASPECNLAFAVKDNTIEGYGKFMGKKKTDFSIPVLYEGPTKKETEQVEYIVNYRGDIVGKSIRFKKWIYEKGKQSTTNDEPQANGLMIVSNELDSIDVYEKETQKKEAFYKINQVEIKNE